MRRGAVVVSLAATILGSAAPLAQSSAQAPPQRIFDKLADRRDARVSSRGELLWQSSSVSKQEIPRDLATLYGVLQRFSSLPTVKYLDRDGLPVATIMRRQELVFGAFFPVEIDRVLCSLNRHVCKIVEGHTAPVWANRPGDTLTLPDLKFDKVRVLHGEMKTSKQRIKDVVRAREGCDTYDASCWTVIERLNDATLDELDRLDGEVVIPALTVRVQLPATVPTAARAQLAPNLVATATFKEHAHGADQEPLFQEQKRVFELVKHPLALNGQVPDCSTIHVGVIDNEFGRGLSNHCEFHDGPGSPTCGQNGGVARIADHGTHVAGIIGARANGRGVVGMSPSVKLHTGSFISGLDGNTAELEQVIGKLKGEDGVDVFNLSFEYKRNASARPDLAENAIRRLRNALFVTSAGNEGLDKSNVCDVRPACLSRELNNVISVIALDLDAESPALWHGSNEGSNFGTVFDLAAPGLDILSTIADGTVAPMSGTSQAAPMVTAAASLLLGLDDKLRPVYVKRRLIATSDFLPSLADKALGGRLNVQRALSDIDSDVFEMNDGDTWVGRFADNTHSVQVLKRDGSPASIPTASIQRWVCKADQGCTMVFVNANDRLEKWVMTQVLPATSDLRVVVDNKVKMLNATRVKDFTARIRDGSR